MRLDHALQVFAREHYASNVAAWSCTAAPIHDPITGKVLGALDITGRDEVAAPAVLGLVRAAVAAAETELRIRAMYPTGHPPERRPQSASSRRTPTRSTITVPQLLSVLGRDRAVLAESATGRRGTELSVRHSELLFLLAQHPEGYTRRSAGDRPARAGRPGGHRARRAEPVALAAARARTLRAALPDHARPCAPTWPRSARAWPAAMSPAPSTPTPGRSCRRSESPEVQAERDLLHREIRSAVLRSTDAASGAAFANGPCSRDDMLVWRHAVGLADPAIRPGPASSNCVGSNANSVSPRRGCRCPTAILAPARQRPTRNLAAPNDCRRYSSATGIDVCGAAAGFRR